jgi:proton-dependent oligopeptide transporter, POT family
MSQTQISAPLPPEYVPLLFAERTWERFSYYGMRALLVLYLVRSLSAPMNPGPGWTESKAYMLYGWYASLIFLLPIIWGQFANKFLGIHRSILIGGLTITLGHIVLAVTQTEQMAESGYEAGAFMGGLVLMVMGTGYFGASVRLLESQAEATDPATVNRITLSNLRVKLGVFGCVLLCGTLAEEIGWLWGFAALAVAMIAGMIAYCIGRWKLSSAEAVPGRWSVGIIFLAASLGIASLVGWLYQGGNLGWIPVYLAAFWQNESVRNAIPAILGPLLLALVVWYISVQDKGQRASTAALLIIMVFYALFWMGFHQLGSTVNVFAERGIDRQLYGWKIPVTWFQAFNVLLILFLAPGLTRLQSSWSKNGRAPTQATNIGISLFALGIGFAFLVWAARLNADGAKAGFVWLVAAITALTLAELWLFPADLSFLQRLTAAKSTPTLVLIWFIALFLANLSGGFIASYAESIERGEFEMFWYQWGRLGGRADFFLLFVLTSIGGGLVALLVAPLYRRMTTDKV